MEKNYNVYTFIFWTFVVVLLLTLMVACQNTSNPENESLTTPQSITVAQQSSNRPLTTTLPLTSSLVETSILSFTETPSTTKTKQEIFLSTSVIPSGKLIFSAIRDDTDGDGIITHSDDRNLYSFDLGTNEEVQLTFNSFWDGSPNWSPDGQQIVFVSNRTGNNDLFLINLDGTGLKQLTNTPANENDPIWSPNGDYIAYQRSTPLAKDGNVYIMNVNDSEVKPVFNSTVNYSSPDWSPDGRFLLLYKAGREEDSGIHLLEIESGAITQLTPWGLGDHYHLFGRAKWIPRSDGYFISIEVDLGDCGGSCLNIYQIEWVDHKPSLTEKIFDVFDVWGVTWGNGGEWLIASRPLPSHKRDFPSEQFTNPYEFRSLQMKSNWLMPSSKNTSFKLSDGEIIFDENLYSIAGIDFFY